MLKSIVLGWAVGSIQFMVGMLLRVALSLPLPSEHAVAVQLGASLLAMMAVAALCYRLLVEHEARDLQRAALNHIIRNQLQIVRYSATLLKKQPNPQLLAGIDDACEHICGALDSMAHVAHIRK